MEFNIFRPLTEEEKVDSIPVKHTSVLDSFLKELAKYQTKYQKLLRPYDSYSARMDFDSYLKTKSENLVNTIDKTLISTKIDFGELDTYAELSRFEFIDKNEVMTVRLVEGMKKEIISGFRFKFKCMPRGNTLTIVVSATQLGDFEKWLDKEFLKKEEKEEEKDSADTKEADTDSEVVVNDLE